MRLSAGVEEEDGLGCVAAILLLHGTAVDLQGEVGRLAVHLAREVVVGVVLWSLPVRPWREKIPRA